jgi:hypothetical protein
MGEEIVSGDAVPGGATPSNVRPASWGKILP